MPLLEKVRASITSPHRIYTGDLLPVLEVTLSSAAGAVDVSTATEVRLKGRRDGSATMLFDRVPTVDVVGDTSVLTMPWEAADLDWPGYLVIEAEVTWPDTVVQTFRSLDPMRVVADLDWTPPPTPPGITPATWQEYVTSVVAATAAATKAELIAGAPDILNTFEEISNALNDDANLAATLMAALTGKQPLATMLTKLAALAGTLTDGQLIRWDATLGEPVAVNPVGAGRLGGFVKVGTPTTLPPGAAGGVGATQTVADSAFSVTNSNGRPVNVRFGASFNQTVAGRGAVFMVLRETTAGNAADRKIMVTPLTGSATPGETFVTNSDEFDIGVVTTTRTFEIRAYIYSPAGQTPTAQVYNSATAPTWARAEAA